MCTHPGTKFTAVVAAEIAFLALSHHQDGKKLPPAVVCLANSNTCTRVYTAVPCHVYTAAADATVVYTAVRTAVRLLPVMTGEPNDGVLCVDCDSRRAVEPIRTIRGVI